ncbi:uncharacterized protein [Apostichopus japonicus]|uniref:uncharacterized protein n=1 Tax=Stichopus japonicus TaxID=307972 RepID=UPI003AB12329
MLMMHLCDLLAILVYGLHHMPTGWCLNCTASEGFGPLEFFDGDCCKDIICHTLTTEVLCISCSATNLCSVRWFKDDELFTPPSLDGAVYSNADGSILQIDPQTPSLSYVGKYTCKVCNRTHTVEKTFYVQGIEEPPYTDPPLECRISSCSDQQENLGDNATFVCSFCAQEKTNELKMDWQKMEDGNWTSVTDLNITGTMFTTWKSNVSQELCVSTVCAEFFLVITNVTIKTYGSYRLVTYVESTNQSSATNPLQLLQGPGVSDVTITVVISIAGVTVVILLIILLWHAINLEVRLFLKDRFGTVEEKGQRSHDAFVAYDSSSEEDRAFVLEFIRPKLMACGYVVYVKDIDVNGGASFAEEILEAVEVSLRCVLVISPTFMSSRLMGLQVNAALDQMTEHQTKIIPILFGDIKEKKWQQIKGLSALLAILRCIHYKEGKTNRNKFMKRLLLRMPKRSKRERTSDILLNSTSDTTPLTPDL